MVALNQISEAVISGNADRVRELTEQRLSEGGSAVEILNEGLIAGMGIVGERFKKLEVYVPEVLVAARAMNWGVEVLKPALKREDVAFLGTVVIGTVKGDVHDIGKNLVTMMMEGAGFKVIDLGTNVPAEGFLDSIRKHNPDIVGMSALLTTTMSEFKKTIDAFQEAGLRDNVKVMVGGAPVNESYALQVGADAYGETAVEAVEKAREFLSKL